MHFFTDINILLYTSCTIGGLIAAAPLYFKTIDTVGGGPLNGGIPTVISTGVVRKLQLAQFLENLEVLFFNTSLTDITRWGTNRYHNDTIEVQEEVHLASLTNLLKAYNTALIPPYNYSFPMNSTKGFFELAHLITSVGIGATIRLTERLVATDPLLVKSVSSVLTVKSRHDAFFRHIQGEVPNPAPFDTGISGIWAYNLALSFIVPGSCPIKVPLPILSRLRVVEPAAAIYSNSTDGPAHLEFTWDPTQMSFVAEAGKQLLIRWVNQLDVPVYT